MSVSAAPSSSISRRRKEGGKGREGATPGKLRPTQLSARFQQTPAAADPFIRFHRIEKRPALWPSTPWTLLTRTLRAIRRRSEAAGAAERFCSVLYPHRMLPPSRGPRLRRTGVIGQQGERVAPGAGSRGDWGDGTQSRRASGLQRPQELHALADADVVQVKVDEAAHLRQGCGRGGGGGERVEARRGGARRSESRRGEATPCGVRASHRPPPRAPLPRGRRR